MITLLLLLLAFSPFGLGCDLYALPKTALACAAVAWSFHRAPLEARPSYKVWGVFAAALLASTFFSWDPGASLVGVDHSRGLGVLQWLACALLYVHGLNSSAAEVDLAIGFGGGLMALYAVAEALSPNVLLQGGWWNGRAGSTQGHPVVLGEALVVLLPFSHRFGRLLPLLILAAIMATRSRSAILAAGVVGAYLAVKRLRRCT